MEIIPILWLIGIFVKMFGWTELHWIHVITWPLWIYAIIIGIIAIVFAL